MTISLANRRFYYMRNLILNIHYLTTGRQATRQVGTIGPYGAVNVTINGNEPITVGADYTTNGGLKAFSNISTLTSPDHVYPRLGACAASYFRYGMRFTINLTEPCYWNVSIVGPDGRIVESRSGPGETINVTWNVTAKLDTLPKGMYQVILSLRDMVGNQPTPIVRYRYPLHEPPELAALLASAFPLVRRLGRRFRRQHAASCAKRR